MPITANAAIDLTGMIAIVITDTMTRIVVMAADTTEIGTAGTATAVIGPALEAPIPLTEVETTVPILSPRSSARYLSLSWS